VVMKAAGNISNSISELPIHTQKLLEFLCTFVRDICNNPNYKQYILKPENSGHKIDRFYYSLSTSISMLCFGYTGKDFGTHFSQNTTDAYYNIGNLFVAMVLRKDTVFGHFHKPIIRSRKYAKESEL